MRSLLIVALLAGPVGAQGGNRFHDPSTIVEKDGVAWCFATGNGISVAKRPEDTWERSGAVFGPESMPEWHQTLVPGNRGHLWAPDVVRVGDRWLLYYSVSTFGKNTSAIGVASRSSPGPATKEEPWKDLGVVIRSGPPDRFNAIDPAILKDGERLWMSFGSFWDGIMMVELDPRTGLMKDPDQRPIHLARHGEIEAPFIHKEDGWYYLFVNWGFCCRGVNSTYEIRVGRSREVTGPYLDREGVKMTDGGGTLVLGTEGRFIGPGHASIFAKGGKQWLAHHFYDKDKGGRSDLRLLPLTWSNGWPVVED